MKRPQSAKIGYRGGQAQQSYEDFKEDDFHHKNQYRNKVKIMKPDLTTNDFARIMPKKIHQDKERLYSEGLQLKAALNEVLEENIRLKTRISILEKEKDKMNKYIDTAAESNNKAQSRLHIYSGAAKNNEKENMMVRNLKKMIRDSKEENQYLKQENAKIKKAIKYTKINQLQIERKMLLEENQRINQILVELNNQLADQDEYEQEVVELKNYLEEEVEANKQLSASNQKYIEYIEQLEEKMKKDMERAQEKQKKLQRQLALQKRKVNQSVKQSDDLRKQIKVLKETNQSDFKKKPKGAIRPVSSHPYQPQNRGEGTQSGNFDSKKEMELMKAQNKKLQQELSEMKMKLQKSSARIQEKEKLSARKITTQEALKLDSEPKEQQNSKEMNQPFIIEEEKKVQAVKNVVQEDQYYEQQFDDEDHQYNKDFEEESGEAEQIFKKDEDDKKVKKSNEKGKGKGKEKEKKKKNGKFIPDKAVLKQIKQLITYRVKAHRYPYSELEKDIRNSEQNTFNCLDLEAMVKGQPFFLKPEFAKIFLQYAFQNQHPPIDGVITNQVFLTKMRKLISDFQLMNEQEEEQMLLRIAEMTTTYPGELEASFEQVKNGPETISKEKLVQMFKRLELADHYIEAIITELSLCSQDLEHLNFHGFFERFYIEDAGSQADTNAIDEQQIESSGEQNRKNQIPKIDEQEEYEDDKVNLIMEDEGELSMGMKNKDDYDDDIVSDDGHI